MVLQSMKLYAGAVLLGLMLAACTPIVSASGEPAQPVVAAQPAGLTDMSVSSVSIEIGVGSPIPVDAFISAELPDICARLAEVKVDQAGFEFAITLRSTRATGAACLRDTLPFRMAVPLNMLNQPAGTYTVKANGATTTFKWPAGPTITPESIGAAPALQTYRSPAYGVEVDYPAGWISEGSGDGAIFWSRPPERVGVGGLPADLAKIDLSGELGTILTLDELLARQKQGVAEVGGRILSEEEWTLANGLRAVRLSVSAIGDNVTLLTVVDGHPVVLTGYGDVSRFDEVARTLRAIHP